MVRRSIRNTPIDQRESLLFWLGLFIAYAAQMENLDKTKLHQLPQTESTGELIELNGDLFQSAFRQDQFGIPLDSDREAAQVAKLKAETEFLKAEAEKARAQKAQAEAETQKAIADTAQTKKRIKNPIELGSLIIAILSFLLTVVTTVIVPTTKSPAAVVPTIAQWSETSRLRKLIPNGLDRLLYFVGPFLLHFSDTLRAAEFSLTQGADPTAVRDSLIAKLESVKAHNKAQITAKGSSFKSRTQQQVDIKRIDTLIRIFSKV